MNQSVPLYVTAPAVSLLDPWLRQHLPDLTPTVLRRFIQLVTGIFETRSLRIETIADSTCLKSIRGSSAKVVG